MIELATATGHQLIQMPERYYQPTAEALAAKLGKLRTSNQYRYCRSRRWPANLGHLG